MALLISLTHLTHSGIISFVAIQFVLQHLSQNGAVFILSEKGHTRTHTHTQAISYTN